MWCKEGWSDATCCEGLTCVSVDVADGMLIYISKSLVIYLSTCLLMYLRNNIYTGMTEWGVCTFGDTRHEDSPIVALLLK